MTVIHGPNEAGKSTWHAAVYAGLCGMRRTKGMPSREDRAFKEHHKPWTGARWRVTARVVLEDGRTIELRQDLDGRVDCTARDVSLGRDFSNEIMFEGAPDGSRWLGLDRRSFLATACVRQTEVLQVKEDASALQHHLQRAADTAGADQTAALALVRIDEFRSENVGQQRANSSKPLARAMRALDDAHRALRDARNEQSTYLKLIADADRLQHIARAAQERLSLFRTAVARRAAEVEAVRLNRARVLLNSLPDGAPPPLAQDDDQAQAVRAALDVWERRPTVSALPGESLDSLRAQLEALPSMPSGETSPDSSVLHARQALTDSDAALADHAARVPIALPSVQSIPAAAPVAQHGRSIQPFIVAGVLILLGLAISAAGLYIVGLPLAGIGVAFAAINLRHTQGTAASHPREGATAPVHDQAAASWRARTQDLEAARLTALQSLAAALASRGFSADAGDRASVDAAFDAYVRACAERAGEASAAARRHDLEARIVDRQRAEAAAVAALSQVRAAREALLRTASECGVDETNESGIVDGLRQWLNSRSERLQQDEQRRAQWTELRTLLGGQKIEDLAAQVEKLQLEAEQLNQGVSGSIDLESDLNAQRTRLETAVHEARRAADEATGMAQARRKSVPAVAEAEEAVARAEADLENLRHLDLILERTREFLVRAQDRVHREIAPVLASGLTQWLPRVTGGRYLNAVVDPETLDVQVSGADDTLRYAHMLSHGTAEQVYLLLRAIMARHLVKPGEVSPLILDDVTAHCDPQRQCAVLHVLHEISTEHQVILFAQEDAVLHWAHENLKPSRDCVVELREPVPLMA